MTYKKMGPCADCLVWTDNKRCPSCQRVADKRFYITAIVIVITCLSWMALS